MSRTIPRAYVTAAWNKNRVTAEDQARKYCGELVKAGYLPLCPVLAFSGIIAEDDPDGEKKRREMSEDLLKDKVEKAENQEEAKEIIKEAGMELTDEEMDQVAGGLPLPLPE